MTLRLLLIRHGLSSFNRENRIQGRNDLSKLTDEGITQANRVGKALEGVKLSAVYSSPLQRAAETAREVLREKSNAPEISFEKDLLEVDLAQWTGMTKMEIKEKYPEESLTWRKNPNNLILQKSDGTTFKPIESLFTQAERFLKKLIENHNLEEDNTVLIVGHNAILRCLIMQLLNKPLQGIRRIKLDNASISILNLKPNKKQRYTVQIESLNSTTHIKNQLPKKGQGARIILVRHGETNWNKEGRFQGQIDIPLNSNGKTQAMAARSFLQTVSINKAFSSSMARPLETAKIILNGQTNLKIFLEKELIEINHGDWEGKLESEIKEHWDSLLELWKKSPHKVQMPNGESIHEVWNRAIHCWERIANSLSSNDTALVVAHDAVNKTILCNLLGLQPENIWLIKQGNGGVTVVDIPPENDDLSLITCMNITSHLGGIFDKTAHGAL